MNRPFLRALAVKLGYTVQTRSGHGARAWDWSPKHQMLNHHFRSEAEAWADLEKHMHRKVREAERIVRTAADLIREG